jgi:hypothetical protein
VCRLCNIKTIHFVCLAKRGEVEPKFWFCDECEVKVREFKRAENRKRNKMKKRNRRQKPLAQRFKPANEAVSVMQAADEGSFEELFDSQKI